MPGNERPSTCEHSWSIGLTSAPGFEYFFEVWKILSEIQLFLAHVGGKMAVWLLLMNLFGKSCSHNPIKKVCAIFE